MSPDKMSQKLICKYENFGFCKKREDCENLHPTENCFVDNCNIINCTKRHPQPCRFFGTQEGCRFGSSCKFDHRRQMCLQSELQEMKNKQAIQEDTIRQLNERITSLETKLSTLGNDTLVSNDSNEMISQLKKKRKISISYPNDDNQEVIKDVNEMIDDNKIDIRTDVEMTETCTKDQEMMMQFCEHTRGILLEIKSNIQKSKIEESKRNFKFMKDKFKSFPIQSNEDIKAFVDKLENVQNKWNNYSRNNFKVNSDMDMVQLIMTIQRLQSKIMK